MSTFVRSVFALTLLVSASFAGAAEMNTVTAPAAPLSFEINRGQTAAQVLYLARSREGVLFFTDAGVTLSVPHRGSFRILFDGANAQHQIAAEQPLAARSNYLDPEHGRSIIGVANYEALRYANLYPGIDVRFHGRERHLEHEFVLAAGADASRIALRLEGIEKTRIDANGDAELTLGSIKLRESAPVAWQTIRGHRSPVQVRWNLLAKDRLGFALGDYDRAQPLTIDPVLAYSTHLGGHTAENFDDGTTFPATTIIRGVGVDGHRNVYVGGETTAIDFPTTAGAFDRTPNEVFTEEGTLSASGFVSKFDPTGHVLLYSTFLPDDVLNMAVDSAGHVYSVTGLGPPDNPGQDLGFQMDKLSVDGSHLLYSFLFGQSPNTPACQDLVIGSLPGSITADNSGHLWVAGVTDDHCITGSPTAFQKTLADGSFAGFISKFDTTKQGTASLTFFTFLRGADNISGIAVDSSGNAYLTGPAEPNFPHGKVFGTADPNDNTTGFVTKLNATGSALDYSTLVHGMQGPKIVIDSARNAYVAGSTASAGFPTTTNAFQRTLKGASCGVVTFMPCEDAFVTKFDPTGHVLIFSTLIGGSGSDGVSGIALNNAEMPFITGITSCTDFCTQGAGFTPFPTTSNAFKRTPAAGSAISFVTAFNSSGGSLYYSTLLGGSQDARATSIAVDPLWNAWVVGFTSDVGYPVTPDAFMPALNGSQDGFIAKVVIASDLSVRLTESATTVARNTTDTFTAVVTNHGPDFAKNAVLNDPIPHGFSFAGVQTSTASFCKFPAIGATSGSVVCTKVQLNSGASFQVSLKLRAIAPSGSTLENSVSTSSHMQDLNDSNNRAFVTTHVK